MRTRAKAISLEGIGVPEIVTKVKPGYFGGPSTMMKATLLHKYSESPISPWRINTLIGLAGTIVFMSVYLFSLVGMRSLESLWAAKRDVQRRSH